MDVLTGLNPPQQEAVKAVEGPVLVIAGPGSGKTRVISHRIYYMVRHLGISPRCIMAVTFTNKAAREMRQRVESLLGQEATGLTVGTFHAICVAILRRDGDSVGVRRRFVIYDADDQLAVVKQALKLEGLDPHHYGPQAILSAISLAKNSLVGPEAYREEARGLFAQVVARIYARYQALLKGSNALDFDDLLIKVVELFDTYPDIAARYQDRYRYVMVDEFQDTNLLQYRIIRELSTRHHNIFVVGDPDQAIYSWRFADIRNILNFEKDYPEARVITLEQNYRSTGSILDAASHIISSNCERKPKALWTSNGRGEPVFVVEVANEIEEAGFVATEIGRLLRTGLVKLCDCAVMYRTNAQSRVIEEAFLRRDIPYKLVAGTRFYERREVKDALAYLRLINNHDDNVSLLRVVNSPPRGIGPKTLARVTDEARRDGVSIYEALVDVSRGLGAYSKLDSRQQRAVSAFTSLVLELESQAGNVGLLELFDLVVAKVGYREYLLSDEAGEERWENVKELRTLISQQDEDGVGLGEFLDSVSLVTDSDGYDESTEAVTLITLHQAKGLEFPVVFIIGLEEGLLPHARSMDDPSQMEEERRLCYVGVTRAKTRLYLVYTRRRSFMGSTTSVVPSRFLDDLPLESIRRIENSFTYPVPLSSVGGEAQPFKAGDLVRHPRFGEGVIISYLPIEGDYEVVVAFKEHGVKRLLASLAGLKK